MQLTDEIGKLNDEIVRLEAECNTAFVAGMQHAMDMWERWRKGGHFSYSRELQAEIDKEKAK